MSALSTAQIELMRHHPCFNGEAHDRVGRIHLPVAPQCNIRCNFCERNFCASAGTTHPGWTTKLLSAREALELVRSAVSFQEAEDFVIGVAGPGDPLANNLTFETLGLIHHEYPDITKCVSTNGLLLEDRLPELLRVGVRALTVTVNAADSQIGKDIYSWVKYGQKIYRGKAAAALLISKQFRGITRALDAGLCLKVNTVLIPDINDRHMIALASCLKKAGASLMNIMPLIPSGKMEHYRAPTCEELRETRQACEEIIPQFYRCEQCRADVVYLP